MNNKWTFNLYCMGIVVCACSMLICWLVYPLCLNLAICFFSASIAACSLSIYSLYSTIKSTSRNKGRAVTRSVEIAIQVITPATFPNYTLLTFTTKFYIECETDKTIDGGLPSLNHRWVHCFVSSYLDLLLFIKPTNCTHTQALFFSFGGIRSNKQWIFTIFWDNCGIGNPQFGRNEETQ